jgi:hypothetical protein
VRFLQLLRALIATHLNGLAAKLHLDGSFIQLAIASRTGFLSHVISLITTQSGRSQWATPRESSAVRIFSDFAGRHRREAHPLGLLLEIVPEQSPYAQLRPATLPVRVIYEGRPLAGALLKLTNLEHDAVPLEMHLTDSAGRASFSMPKGRWRT